MVGSVAQVLMGKFLCSLHVQCDIDVQLISRCKGIVLPKLEILSSFVPRVIPNLTKQLSTSLTFIVWTFLKISSFRFQRWKSLTGFESHDGTQMRTEFYFCVNCPFKMCKYPGKSTLQVLSGDWNIPQMLNSDQMCGEKCVQYVCLPKRGECDIALLELCVWLHFNVAINQCLLRSKIFLCGRLIYSRLFII